MKFSMTGQEKCDLLIQVASTGRFNCIDKKTKNHSTFYDLINIKMFYLKFNSFMYKNTIWNVEHKSILYTIILLL